MLVAGRLVASQCSVQSDIVVSQEDLRFSHPQSVATVSFKCECPTSDVLLACGPEWMQALVNADSLRVLGNGICAFAPGQTFHKGDHPFFLYAHSPTLPLKPLQAQFNCA